MQIAEVIKYLETIAPPSLQEGYDNAGLITGNKDWDCTGIITSLDATEAVLRALLLLEVLSRPQEILALKIKAVLRAKVVEDFFNVGF